jgi:hypothetical protein
MKVDIIINDGFGHLGMDYFEKVLTGLTEMDDDGFVHEV